MKYTEWEGDGDQKTIDLNSASIDEVKRKIDNLYKIELSRLSQNKMELQDVVQVHKTEYYDNYKR